ncbi:DUF2970 domain-containing protein [bacterium]|nr:DUF2970 domain-containing protein [bacterium]
MTEHSDQTDDTEQPPPTFWQTAASVLAAFFGVQSRANRERDFTRGKPIHYIVLGLIATVLFVVILMVIVRLALGAAG